MKKFLKKSIFSTASFALFFTFTTAKAQYQLPNSTFETFETGFNGVGQQPTSWKGSNVSQSAPLVGTITKQLVNVESAGRTGNCVYMHNEMVGVSGIAEAPAPAFIALGEPWNAISGTDANSAIGGCTGGLNFTYRPDTLSLWVKRTPSASENARISVYLWSGNSQGSSYKNKGGSCSSSSRTNEEIDIRGNNSCSTTTLANLIGTGDWVSNQTISNWQQIKVPIVYVNNSIPEKINVIISAAAYPYTGGDNANSVKSGSKLWADDLSLIYSSKIGILNINNRSLADFNPGTLEYTYSLGLGVTTIPPITAYRNGRQLTGSEISIINGAVDGAPTTITVTAQDGSSTTTYTINFVSQQSTNPRPEGIKINGTPLATFNGYVTSYNMALPYGTTSCPTIEVIKAEDEQTYTVSNCSSLPGSATVTVYAANTSYSVTYTLNFTVSQLNDNTLQNILIDGEPLANFSPTTNNYTVELPLGTAVAPSITPVSAYPAGTQTIILTENGLYGTSTVKVSSPASSERTYRINFVITQSSNANLSDIKIGGETVENFNPNTYLYNIVLPRGTENLPAITYTKGEPNQTVVLTQGGLNGESRLAVTAQNGAATQIYRLNFSVERSEVSTLNNIYINGNAVSGFRSDSLVYNIELPSGTTQFPVITYDLGDYAQTVRVTGNNLNGAATVRVTAENPVFATVYTLNFSIIRSANAQLADILIDGVSLDGFSPDIFTYSYILPETAEDCPQITVVKAAAGQLVTIARPELTGMASIEVTSETNDGSNIYTIDFVYSVSTNNLLDSIYINNVKLAEFEPEILSYEIALPAGGIAPNVDYFVNDSASKVILINKGLDGTDIAVTAENGAIRTYSITYSVAPGNNAKLANIQLYNETLQQFVSLAGFDAETFEYEIPLEWRVAEIPALNPVKNDENQFVTIAYKGINDTTEITVFAQDGVTGSVYKLYFPVAKSNVKTLSSISVNGEPLTLSNSDYEFNPQRFVYNVKLPYGTIASPAITYEKAVINLTNVIYEQNVEIVSRTLQEPTTIKVFAENGETQTYTLHFSIDMSEKIGQNYLDNIMIGGVPVAGFASETTEYSVVLPYGTTEMPTVEYLKRYPEQSVFVSTSGVYGNVSIKVLSNVSNVAATEYTVKLSVSDIPTVTLSSITFTDATEQPNFDPRVKSYIVPVTAQPTPSYTVAGGLYAVSVVDNHKKLELRIENEDGSVTNTYSFWYYYVNDVIPNASFENWDTWTGNYFFTDYNFTEPTSWHSTGRLTTTIGVTVINNLVSNVAGQSGRGVTLKGKYTSPTYDYPAFITLGTVTTGGSISSHPNLVSGNIPFRNTPDAVYMDYKYSKSGGGNETNMRFIFQIWNENDESLFSNVYTDGNTHNDWYLMQLLVTYSDANPFPAKMNITINSDKAEATIYPTGKHGELTADNVRFGFNSTLTNIFTNGVAIPSFDPTANHATYNINVPAESMIAPEITFANSVPDQEVRITVGSENAERKRIATVLSKAEDNATLTQYNVIFNRPTATVSTLAGISVGGVAVANFAPTAYNYNVPAANSTIYTPDIQITKGEGHQTIAYSVANNVVTVTVSAENGAQSIYTVTLVEAQSEEAELANLAVEGHNIGFAAETFTYNVTLPAAATDIPNITFTKKSNGQTVILTACAVNDTAVIRVAAEDSLHFADYKIIFTKENIATSHLLANIFAGGNSLSNFANRTFEYNSNDAELLFVKEFTQDTIFVEYFTDSIKCFIGENVYKINLVYQPSSDACLQNIFVNHSQLDSYSETDFDYTVSLADETLPDVAVITKYGQTISFVWAKNSVKITVTAQDGVNQNEYEINFVPSNISNYSDLKMIYLDSEMLENFAPQTCEYSVELPEGTTQLPVIQAVKGEPHQTVEIVTNGVSGDVIITVTAQDGTTQSVYTIHFSVALSANALLNDILIGGVSIENFDSQTFNYQYVLPFGTTELPQIAYEKGHPNQTVITADNGVSGDYTFTVTSENGANTNVYTVSFSVAPSPNPYLANIFANNTEIAGFIPEVLEYQVIVIYGTATVPTITWTLENEYQTVEPTFAATLADTTFLLVTAQDGIHTATYKIYFEVKKSNNALLRDIKIDGEIVAINARNHKSNYDFASQQFDYEIILPYGTEILPEITWEGQIQITDYHSIIYDDSGIDGATGTVTIEVTSQDESTTNLYILTFSVAKSDNSKLDDILLKEVSLSDFDADTLFYTIYYPIGTAESELLTAADVVGVKSDPNQTVNVSEVENHIIVITVTAQDGVSTTVYVIEQVILKSDNALLANILIDDVPLKDFSPTKFKYVYKLPFGVAEVPDIKYVKSEETQEVEISAPRYVNDTTFIWVTAEDGITENIYKIFFEVSDENPGETPTAADVCFSIYSYADGVYKASTTKNNVSIVIFDTSGRLVHKANIPLSDPNDDLCSGEVGVKFNFGLRKGQIYIYTFIYNGKKRIVTKDNKVLH
ncbi:MAG: hypothetical protein LBS50_08490 [Prevotellaceae bacterium]|jgi:hypothetical protein|nr:hypothetical protein [Prevotellaceae bacterium]